MYVSIIKVSFYLVEIDRLLDKDFFIDSPKSIVIIRIIVHPLICFRFFFAFEISKNMTNNKEKHPFVG